MPNSYGEFQWQYYVDGTWRTFDFQHSRALSAAHAKGQTTVPMVLWGVEYLARLPQAELGSDATGEFMRLESLDIVTAPAPLAASSPEAAADSSHTAEREPEQVMSAYAQLKERQRAQREALTAEHMRVVLATHAEYQADCREANRRLQNEDSETKAHRAAMNTRTAPVESSKDIGGATSKRSQRLKLCKQYSEGVAAYRSRHPIEAPPPTPPIATGSPQGELVTRILVRARPLFEDEASRSEWNAVSALPHGVVVHEGADKLKGTALVQVLRHHTFGGNMYAVGTDDEVFGAIRYLLERAVAGGIATLFCYGMTGSGKTYSMDGIHRRMPADLFSMLSAAPATAADGAAEVRFSAFDFLGKRCFELLPADFAAARGGLGDAALREESCQKREVFLRVDGEGATHVCGVAEHMACDAEALQHLLHAAVSRRETSATAANATSSRSHAVYLLQLPGGGRLTLIDLAGSEASEESLFHNKQQIAESKDIMNSLAVLRACLRSRSMPDARQVAPFRESVLTRVLKDALTDPSSATALLACVSPACSHTEHSLRTLRTAAYLTGDEEKEVLEEEEVKAPAAGITKEPKHWDHETLQSWVEEQPFAAHVQLPATMDGKAIMKLTQNRLAACCSGDKAVAAELFTALRRVSKELAALALEERKTQTAWQQRRDALELKQR